GGSQAVTGKPERLRVVLKLLYRGIHFIPDLIQTEVEALVHQPGREGTQHDVCVSHPIPNVVGLGTAKADQYEVLTSSDETLGIASLQELEFGTIESPVDQFGRNLWRA